MAVTTAHNQDLKMFMAGLAGHYTNFVERSIDRNLDLVKSILAKGTLDPALARECAERCTAFVDRAVQKNLCVAEQLLTLQTRRRQADDNDDDHDRFQQHPAAKRQKRVTFAPAAADDVAANQDQEQQQEDDCTDDADDVDADDELKADKYERALVYIYQHSDKKNKTEFTYADIRTTDAFYDIMKSSKSSKCEYAAMATLCARGLIEHVRTAAGEKKRGAFRLTPRGRRRARELQEDGK